MASAGFSDERGDVGVELTDDVVFAAWYREKFPQVARLVRLLTGEAAVVEDLTQEVFLRVRGHAPKVVSPDAFVRAVAINVCRNWHRGRRREDARTLRAAPVDRHVVEVADGEMDAVVRSLPYRQRTVLVLRYWLDLSEAEIARVLDCRPGTVKSLHSRAMDTLRKELGDVH